MANVIFVKLHSASLEHVFKDQIVKLDARQIQIATSFGMDLSRPFGRSYSFLVWGWMWPFRAHDRCDCEWSRLQYGCLPKRYSKKIMNDATFESGRHDFTFLFSSRCSRSPTNYGGTARLR